MIRQLCGEAGRGQFMLRAAHRERTLAPKDIPRERLMGAMNAFTLLWIP